jgi:hypothetical protein
MPTYSESSWAYLKERYAQVISDYVNQVSQFDSEDVLRARLHGLGYRGADLQTEINLANMTKAEKEKQRAQDKKTQQIG